MAGSRLPTIDPAVDTGTDLANSMNEWTPYLASTRLVTNSTRPPEVSEGGLWFRSGLDEYALMITVRDDGGSGNPLLSDKVLFSFENPADGGGKVHEGIEIFIDAIGSAPASPATGDLWAVPDGVSEGTGTAETNWGLRIYDNSTWNDVISKHNANILLSDTVGVEPTYGEVNKYYGTLWMDSGKDAASPTVNNGLKVWNGSSYVPSWPVVSGETMLKTTDSNSDPAASGWAIVKCHINNSTGGIFVSTATAWIEVTDKIDFVTDSQDAIDNIGIPDFYEAMNPYYTWGLIGYYRSLNTIQVFDQARWANLVETIGAGANIGKIDPSLTVATGLGYQSTFTAVAPPGDEYPPLEQKGNYYIYLNDPSYTFDAGDLAGETIYKGQGVIFNALGAWEIIDVVLNTDLFVHRDGSLAVYEPLTFTDSVGTNPMKLDYKSITMAAGLAFVIQPDTPAAGEGLHVLDSGSVVIGKATTESVLEVNGLPNDVPSRANAIFKVSATDDEWLGIRFDSADDSWSFDTETGGSIYSRLTIDRTTGYVGVGVDKPTSTFHVGGSAYMSAQSYIGTTLIGDGLLYMNVSDPANHVGTIRINTVPDNTSHFILERGAGINSDTTFSNSGTGDMLFKADNNTLLSVLGATGYVNVGTNVADANLQVYGTILVSGGIIYAVSDSESGHAITASPLNGALQSGILFNQNDAYLSIWDQYGNNGAKINSDGDSWFTGGNIGVGLTVPEELFHVDGSIKVEAQTPYDNPGIYWDETWQTAGVTNCKYIRLPDGTVEIRMTSTGAPSGTLPAGYVPTNTLRLVGESSSGSFDTAVLEVAGADQGVDIGDLTLISGVGMVSGSTMRFFADSY